MYFNLKQDCFPSWFTTIEDLHFMIFVIKKPHRNDVFTIFREKFYEAKKQKFK